MFLRGYPRWVAINEVRRDYDEYLVLNGNPGPVSSNDLDPFFYRDLLWAQAGDIVELVEERLNATRPLVKKLGCAVPVSKKGYVDIINEMAG